MLIDCCLYLDEAELLDLRIEILHPYVDRFVVVEAAQTFSGNDRKPELRHGHWIHATGARVECLLMPKVDNPCSDAWGRESAQREHISQSDAFIGASPEDWLLLGDIDEIPRPELLEDLMAILPHGKFAAFQQTWYYYWLNARDDQEKVLGTRLCRKKDIASPALSRSLNLRPFEMLVPNGGWNFAWLGSVERLQKKIEAFSHQELNTPEFKDEAFLSYCRAAGQTAHNSHQLTFCEIDETYPKAIRENLSRWQKHIHPLNGPKSSPGSATPPATKPPSTS